MTPARSARLAEIAEFLREPRTLGEVNRRFGGSLKTTRRDLAAVLRAAGSASVEIERHARKRWRIPR